MQGKRQEVVSVFVLVSTSGSAFPTLTLTRTNERLSSIPVSFVALRA